MIRIRVLESMSRLIAFAVGFSRDRRGIAATEFAVVVPMMLVMFFGTVEMSSGVAVDRKVTLIAKTLSDLASQSTSVSDTDLTKFFAAGKLIISPYPATPVLATISQLYVNPTTLKASVQWSKGSAPRGAGTFVSIPAALAIGGTYLIYSEASYLYVPAVGYVMGKPGVNLSDVSYTRPRQSTCVLYNTAGCTVL